MDTNTPIILIVDDIPKNLQILSGLLSKEGYEIAFASNGRQAIEIAENIQPDLILLDIMMPEMDGYNVCTILKQNPKTMNIPIIFITGRAETEDVVKGFEVGAVDYITKPFNSVELLSRVRTHIELKRSRDAIVEYSKQLERAQEELKQALAQKDKFFSIIAHDLRGPFTGFIGLSELLTEAYADLGKEEIHQIAQSMNNAAKKLFELLENLLEWSRSQMGRIQYNPMPIELKDLFERITSLFKDTAKNKNITLEIDLPENIIIKADNYMTNTIIRNLISNAIKFSFKDSKIIIGAKKEENYAVIYVKDFGMGMNDEAKQKVFRLDAKYTTQGTANESGTGLGLILCKELTEKQGGTISFESELGLGTTFYVKLPLMQDQN